ncbi:MAG: DMT family transporter [Bacteroidales bacterium]|jgi:drug/metabolite transporter (DMT)-like permease|nr:DMT family transporter [Bacteroidales bacterium]
MQHTKPASFLALFFASLFWGASFVFTKTLLVDFNPIDLVLIRSIIASLFLITICLLFFKKEMKIKKKDLIIICAFSFFEPFLYFIFETYSLKFTSASIVSIIIATIPVFTAFLSRYYYKEYFSKLNIFGIIISVAGIAIMMLPDLSDMIQMRGMLLAFLAVIAAVAYGFFIRKLSCEYNPVVLTAYQNIVALALFLPLFLILDIKNGFPDPIILLTSVNITNIMILSIFCSSIAFIFFIYGIQHLGLGKAVIFSNLIPVFTVIISIIFLKEQFTLAKCIGLFTVVIGVFLVQKQQVEPIKHL